MNRPRFSSEKNPFDLLPSLKTSYASSLKLRGAKKAGAFALDNHFLVYIVRLVALSFAQKSTAALKSNEKYERDTDSSF